jgi:hypothetical protein
MIKDSGFQGDGSLFTSRFEANSPLYASQLNSLSAGIQTALVMPYLGEGPQISYTSSGTIVTNHPAPPTYTGAAKLVPWTVEVQTETDGETTNYFLRTVRGVCNYTWSEFPFSPKTTTTGGHPYLDLNGNRVYDNECIVTDYAVYPSGSYREGTDSTSGWMGGNAAIQIKNAADGGADVWFVTVSKLDWWNKLSWDDADRLQDKERPWVSVFAEGSEADTKILKPTQNSFSLHRLFLPQQLIPPGPIESDIFNGNVIAKHIGYDVKKVASLTWNDTDKKWDIVQYILHQVEIAIPYQQQTIWDYFLYADTAPVNDYQYAVDAHFVGSIDNLALRSGLSSIAGYTINSTDWWYDIIANTTAR